MTRTRVLWLAKGLGRGGAERLLTASVPHVSHDRFDVEVAYVLPHKDAFVNEITGQGIRVHCLDGGVQWVSRLRALVRSRHYHLVHTHAPQPAVAVRLALPRRGPILIHTEHNVWPRYRRVTYALNAATYHRNAAVVAVSRGVADSIVRPPWMRWARLPPIEVLHHGIDDQKVRCGPQARRQGRELLGLDVERAVVGSVANFTPKKDHSTLLRAVRELAHTHPDLVAVLVGTGPCEREVRRLVDELGLADHVRFTGIRDDVQDLLPAFDVFVLSSLHEGLSIALLEAMAAGVPAVCTRVGGVPEAMTHGHEGLLVPPRDPGVLASALGKLLADSELRSEMGAAARETARRFSIRAAVQRLEELYDEVLA